MPIFDYNGKDARELISDAWSLAAYTNGNALGGVLFEIPGFSIGGDGNYNTKPPLGWRELTPDELGLDVSLDYTGSFIGRGVIGAQAKVFGRFNEGSLDKVAFSITGTTTVFDVPGYVQMVNDDYVKAYDYLLEAVRSFTLKNNLTGEDVLVTGYSLGAGVANSMYSQREGLLDGFYKDSDYVTGESPKIVDSEGIYNFGFENDIVFRIAGTTSDVLTAALDSLTGNDVSYVSTTDNIVLFNLTYAQPTWPTGPFSILNLTGWIPHVAAAFTNPIEVIGSSRFYEYIERDSTIVISDLDSVSKSLFWVEDKNTTTSNHYGSPAFLLGTSSADKIKDGGSDDFLEGFSGDDQFRLSSGVDVVAGGGGDDKVFLKGGASDYESIRLNDGALILNDKSGLYGLKELFDVERIEFDGVGIVQNIFSQSYDVTVSGLDYTGLSPLQPDKLYSSSIQGGESADLINGSAGRDLLFGLSGNDNLNGSLGDDLLHGGSGDDILQGGIGNDQLYGSAGNDRLVGEQGNDQLSGGVGSDTFVFNLPGFGVDRITDFNIHNSGSDRLEFSLSSFSSVESVLSNIVQQGEDSVISVGGDSVTLVGVVAGKINYDMIILV
ncbi:calcium-binding protein [Pseudomonas aeruginosa]|uniref:calcium-binding protein n=1 Tax=Pseudomonas aeruginosa TaxID=287 RepID=UPI0009FA910C|nr:calcium-binding protein [Pseudomonas aeruginosa]ORE36617.1 type I secretion target [Pseudomonas aeruginosa]RUJ16554.1 calcium-binding protein [Pseudomonas aeruginosa]